jgi:predicted component of type VI protein secretion system
MLELNPSGTVKLQIALKFDRMDDLEPNWIWTKTFRSYAEGQALHRKLLMKEDLTYLQQFEQVFTVYHDSPTRMVERLDLQDATKQDIIL